MGIKKFFGDKKFYKMILGISVPIMIQNGVMNFVNLLDNVMVGQLGTESMSAVSIVNNLIFVFNLLIFGAISSAGIFTAQYHGSRDIEGIKHTFRFKIIIVLVASALGIATFLWFGEELIGFFLHQGESQGDLVLTMKEAKKYLLVMIFGLVPYAISSVYASTLRETEKTVLPMIASVSAVVTNFVLNYILIFGNFGAPALGVKGAAIATVISRFVELLVLIIWTHANVKKCAFIKGAYRSLYMPKALIKDIAIKGLPLLFNELMWSLAITITTQCYSTRGLDVVAALNISTTINNVFNVVYLALGNSIAIVIGNLLGASKLEEARDTDRKMVTFAIICATAISTLLLACSPFIPLLYKTTEEVRELATFMIIVLAVVMPFNAFTNAAYFTLRSGGQVLITFLFDAVYMWVVVVPVAMILSRCTDMGILLLFPICHSLDIVKSVFGFLLIRSNIWIKKLVV